MRKNFMLSLTAMAALPMAGFADATWSVPADNSSITDWAKVEDTDLSSSSTEQIIGIGAGISQNLTLVKGKYTVTVAKLSNAEFAIRVGDKTYSSGEQFTLTDETNTVTLEVTTKDTSKQFTVGGIEIILDFNFATAKTALTNSLTDAVSALPATEAERDFWQKEIATANEQAGIKTRIDELEDLDGGDKTAYDKYVAEGLYKETSNIQAAINALSAEIQKANQYKTDYKEVLAAFDGLNSKLNDLKAKVDVDAETGTVTGNATPFAKDTYKVAVTDLKTAIETFKGTFNYESKEIFKNKTKQQWIADVTNKEIDIDALSKDIDNADLDADAFADLQDDIERATKKYYAHQTTLKFKNNADYATLSEKALKKLEAAYYPVVKLKEIKCSVGYSKQEKAKEEANKKTNQQIIAAAEDAMDNVKTTFERYYDTVEDHFDTVNGYAESVEAYKEAIDKDKLEGCAQYVNIANEKIQEAKAELETAMATVSDNGLTLPENYKDLQNAVDYLEVNYLLASASSAFTAAKTAVEGMVKGEYHEASFWTKKVESIQQTLYTFEAYSDDEKVAKKSDIIDLKSGSICNYKADAQAAFNKYDAVTEAITYWTTQYEKVAKFVTNPTVTFEYTVESVTYKTTYGDALSKAETEINSNKGDLKTAVDLKNTDAAHATAMKYLTVLDITTTDPVISAILNAKEADYINAKNKYELPQTIASAQSLAKEVEAKAAAVLAKLKLAYNTYNGYKDDYGKRYADEIWGTEDEAKLNPYKKENFWSIRQRYYNVQGVEQQEGETKGVYTAVTTPKDAKYEEAIKNITTLKEHLDTFVVINKAVDDLNTLAAQIQADFKANNDAYDEFLTSTSWKTAETNAEEIKKKNTDKSRTKEFEDLYDGVINRLKTLKAALDKSKEAETFIADKTGFTTTLNGINDDIKKHIAAAVASTKNLEAKEAWEAQITTDLYETDGTTKKKKTVAALETIQKVDNPGHTHFADVVKDLEKAITTLEDSVPNAYKYRNAETQYENYGKGEIKRIADGIKAAVEDCRTNDVNYAKLDSLNKDVEDFYIKIYYKISETGQITDKDKWLVQLDTLDTVDQTLIDEAFAAGELSKEEKYKYYEDQYTARKATIVKINANWIDQDMGYLASVADANSAEFAKITNAYDAAVGEYRKAIEGLKPFLDYDYDDQRWNVVVAKYNADIFNAKKALDDAYAKATAENNDTILYNAALTGETVKNAKYFDGSKYYSCTTNDKGEIKESGSIIVERDAISDAYKKAIDELNAATKEHLETAIKAVETNLGTAIDRISAWIHTVYQNEVDDKNNVTKNAREKFFGGVDAELTVVRGHLKDDKLAVNYLNSRDKAKDYDDHIAAIETQLTAVLDTLAQEQYKAWIDGKEAMHTELCGAADEGADKGLFAQYPEIAKKYQAGYEAAETELNASLKKLGTNFTPTYYGTDENGANRMEVLNDQFETFYSNNGYDDFKSDIETFKQNEADNEAAYKKFIDGTGAADNATNVNAVEGIIDDAASYASKFIAGAATIAGVQSKLDDLKAQAKEHHAIHDMKDQYDVLLPLLNDVKSNADNLKAAINKAEHDSLKIQLANLKSDYNLALIDANKESEEMKACLERILGYQTKLEGISVSDLEMTTAEEETIYDKLFTIQKGIIDDRNALAGDRVEGIYTALRADLGGLTGRYNTMAEAYDALYDFQKENIQQSPTPFVEDQSTLLLENIETSKTKDWMLIDEASLKTRIDAWKDTLKNLEDAVAAAKTAHDADVDARTRLKKELTDIQNHVTNLLENELFQQFGVKNYWSNNYESWFNWFIEFNENDINSVPTTEGKLKDQDPDNPTQLQNINRYTSYITYFERESYYNEVSYRYDGNNGEYTTVVNALANINGLLTNPTVHILKKNKEQYIATHSTLYREAEAVWDFINNLYMNFDYSNYSYYTIYDIKGDLITDEAGNVGKFYEHSDFVGEAVPEVIKEFKRILYEAEKLKSDIQAHTYKPGNIDQDEKGNVSLSDFTLLQNIILGRTKVTEVQEAAADLNNDGRVDISDLMKLVQVILNPSAAPAPARVRVAIPHATTDDALSIIVEGEGVHQRIGILLDAEQTYAGCQMDITLPEGVTLAAETTGEMAGALSLLSNDLENGSHRILLSSVESAGMNTGNGALLWLDVNVDHNYNGEGISLSNVLFANSYGRAFELAIAAGETTGLSNVSMTQEVKEMIYNASGILMDGLKRGVNIIRGNDGSSKKVIVK